MADAARSARVWRADATAILQLAWPVFVGQVAVLGFSTVDTLLAGRVGPVDLAALAIGSAAYITVFVGLMGAMLALGPLAGRLHGAGRRRRAGAQFHQALWLGTGLSVPGLALLLWPEPFLLLAQAEPAVAERVRDYLRVLAWAVPAGLWFTAYRAFNTAVSRPKAVMALQVGGFALKVPLSALLVFGAGPVPALGVVGCAWATVAVNWLEMAIGWAVLQRDPFYRPYRLPRGRLQRPHRATLRQQLSLGLPMAASMLIEVTGFTFMALFIARLGTVAVAGHQIAANLTGLLFMLPLALANASSTLVAQAIGARRDADARRLGWHGVELAVAIAVLAGAIVFLLRPLLVRAYSGDAAVAAVALPLLAWVAVCHVGDAAQTVAAYVLRAWHITTRPMFVYAAALWGVGLGGGFVLAFLVPDHWPAAVRGPNGFWAAATAGLASAALALGWLLRQTAAQHPAVTSTAR